MKKLKRILATLSAVSALAIVSVNASALDESTTTAMTTGFTAIKDDVLSGLAIVAPVALGVFGAFLVWRYGKKFFNSVAK